MCHKCVSAFFSAMILIFSFWWISFSKWIIICSAAIILFCEIFLLSRDGCSGFCIKKTGSELFMEKTEKELHSGPKKEELEKTLKKK